MHPLLVDGWRGDLSHRDREPQHATHM